MMSREEIIRQAASGNPFAETFLRAYVGRAHWLDDLVDEPRHPCCEVLARHEAEWLQQLTGNPFFTANSARLVPLMLTGLNAWVDSNRMPPGPVRDVLKAQWHELVHAVALVTGGWDALRKLTRSGREYDFETVPIAHLPPAITEPAKGGFNGVVR